MFEVRELPARTLIWWYDQRDRIDFNPVYQRKGGIWNVKDKAFLIDSIINEYDIPKVYVADFTYGQSSLKQSNTDYSVIDGKQRFEAIFDFIDGKFSLDSSFEYAKDP